MTLHFIADLHLGAGNPAALKLLKQFLAEQVQPKDSVYILGDLFEHWMGDDVSMRANREAVTALADSSARGVHLYYMYGNRDFLIRDAFLTRTGCQLLDDPTVIKVGDDNLLLMHGDLLCTDDHKYQKFRSWARQDETMRRFLRKPKLARALFVRYIRFKSKRAQQSSTYEIVDVNHDAVAETMRAHDVTYLLHGHTHRADVHHFDINGQDHHRIVLGDWHDSAQIVSIDDGNGDGANSRSLAEVALKRLSF